MNLGPVDTIGVVGCVMVGVGLTLAWSAWGLVITGGLLMAIALGATATDGES